MRTCATDASSAEAKDAARGAYHRRWCTRRTRGGLQRRGARPGCARSTGSTAARRRPTDGPRTSRAASSELEQALPRHRACRRRGADLGGGGPGARASTRDAPWPRARKRPSRHASSQRAAGSGPAGTATRDAASSRARDVANAAAAIACCAAIAQTLLRSGAAPGRGDRRRGRPAAAAAARAARGDRQPAAWTEHALAFPAEPSVLEPVPGRRRRALVAASLAAMGYRFDGATAGTTAHAPTLRELASALSLTAGFDPRALRRPAGQRGDRRRCGRARPCAVEEYLRAPRAGPGPGAGHVAAGPRAARLGELWDIWGRLRPAPARGLTSSRRRYDVHEPERLGRLDADLAPSSVDQPRSDLLELLGLAQLAHVLTQRGDLGVDRVA